MQSSFASSVLDGGLNGFDRLLEDLERFGGDFLFGDGLQFRTLAAAAK
jgi:hypothetical protein